MQTAKMTRIKFPQQRLFLNYVMQKLQLNLVQLAKSARLNYELLKKQHQERLFFEESDFLRLCKLGKIKPSSLEIERLEDNWGKILGGKRGMKVMRLKYANRLKYWAEKGGRS